MRFFSEFVSCWAPTNTPAGEDFLKTAVEQPTIGTRRRKRRSCVSSSSAEWKPTLSAISEDKVVVVIEKEPEDCRTVGSQKTGARKSRSRNARVHLRSNDGDWRDPVTVGVPMFLPTPFLI